MIAYPSPNMPTQHARCEVCGQFTDTAGCLYPSEGEARLMSQPVHRVAGAWINAPFSTDAADGGADSPSQENHASDPMPPMRGLEDADQEVSNVRESSAGDGP